MCIIRASNGEHGHESLSRSCHVCQQEEDVTSQAAPRGPPVTGAFFNPLPQEQIGQNEVSNI